MQNFINLLNTYGVLKTNCPGTVRDEKTNKLKFSDGEADQKAEFCADRLSQEIHVECPIKNFPSVVLKILVT